MAQLNVTFDEHVALITLLKQNDSIVDANPELQRVLKGLESLHFNTKKCAWCGTEFEAPNDRKTTCSAKCRKALSRANSAPTGLAAAASHTPTVTPDPIFAVGDQVNFLSEICSEEGLLGTITECMGFLEEEVLQTLPNQEHLPAGWFYAIATHWGETINIHECLLERHTATVTTKG